MIICGTWHLIKYLAIPDFDCKNNTLGYGFINKTIEKPCDDGKEGNIIYKCQINLVIGKHIWDPIQDNCVVRVIKELETTAQVTY